MSGRTFITADHHFGHANIIRHTGRPFANADEMNRRMVEAWNAVVRPDDVVYHLGDLFWSETVTRAVLPRLRGTIHLLLGNHDKRWKPQRFVDIVIEPLIKLIAVDGVRVVLCHYPLLTWPGAHHGTWHFHGHSHGKIPNTGRRVDVGVDRWDFLPMTVGGIVERVTHEQARLAQTKEQAP